VGEHVFLKVKAKRSSLRLGRCPKLATRYCEPFEILEKIRSVSYILAFPASIRVYNVFHLSLFKKYVPDPIHIIDWVVIQVEHEGDFHVEPILILDRKVKVIKNKAIGLVKVQWTCYGLKMKHGRMKKLCGRNTHNVLSILKKREYKNARLHFEQQEFQNNISYSYPTELGTLTKESYNPMD
jgi:hypothetical protein